MHALNKVQVSIIIDIQNVIQSFLMENSINQNNNQRQAGVQAPSEPSKRCSKPKQVQSYIPFLFKNKPSKPVDASGPAPGQYESRSTFEHKNDRDLLLQKYNILMQNTKKIKQSVVFKSSAKRFNYKEEIDSTPISYAYRMSEAQGVDGKAGKFKHVVRKTMNSLRDHEVYPSIPDNSSKFGYSLGKLGKLNKINKSQNQLQKEREAMREYAKKLEKERSNHSDSSYMEAVKQKGHLIQKLKQKVTSTAASLSLTTSTVKPGSVKGQKKPKPAQNAKGNPVKIHKVLEEKSSVVNKLGPGCYDVNQGTFGKLLKPERFQFFSSSSERFPCHREEELQKDSNYVKKLEIQSKINEARKTKSTNFRRGLKKPQRPSDKTQRSSKQDDQPGPGAYNPTQKLVKAKLGRVSPFDKSTRFDPLQKQNLPPPENPLRLCRQVSKSTLPEKSPFHNKHLLKYTEIMQRNKELLKNKRVQMEESLKKYRTNQNSQYSICSWESRPFSRNQGLPSVLKESRREG